MKRKTIRNHKDFYAPNQDLAVHLSWGIVKAKAAMIPGDARYGIISAKKTFKLAVDRNRAKRLVRDWISYNEDKMLPDLDYIFILRSGILETSREKGRKDLSKAFNNISKIYLKNEKDSTR